MSPYIDVCHTDQYATLDWQGSVPSVSRQRCHTARSGRWVAEQRPPPAARHIISCDKRYDKNDTYGSNIERLVRCSRGLGHLVIPDIMSNRTHQAPVE